MLKHIFKCIKLPKLQVLPKPGERASPKATFSCSTFVNYQNYGPNLKLSNRHIHTCPPYFTKLFYEYENAYAFGVINSNSSSSPIESPTNEAATLEDFNSILNQNWRESTASEIVKAFVSVKNYCVDNKIAVSDTRFDRLVDGLMDHCEKLTDTELFELLSCLCELPRTKAYTSHNFHDIWSCLDDVCCWKMIEWDIEKMLFVGNFWYKLSLGKVCDYIFSLIDRLVKKADSLTKDQLVKVFFYLNICRKRPVDFEYEFALDKQINNMNVNEMAVVAMGYFKSKTRIKLSPILLAMVQQVTEHSESILDIALTAIIKVLRYSKPTKIVPQIQLMLDKLTDETDRLSELCCLHIALIGTEIQYFHKKSLEKVTEKIVKNITNMEKIRLKDIERLLNVLSMFNFNPRVELNVYEAAYKELHSEERLKEAIQYPRCLPCALHYLSLRNIYSYELMNKLLDVDFIKETYGNSSRNVPEVLFSLNASIDVECPDYNGNRLPPALKYKAAKWLTVFTPSYDQYKKITAAEQLVLDTIDTVKAIVKDEKLMYIDHVLPHFSRADIILCRDKLTGDFIEPRGFENYVLGDIMFPIVNDNHKWFAIVILGWHNTIRDSSLPLGHMLMKERQLRKIGYTPVFVIWNEFMRLTKEDQCDYVLRKLS